MSMISEVFCAGLLDVNGVPPPVSRTLPGRYMTAVPLRVVVLPTAVQLGAAGSSANDLPDEVAIVNTLPSGSRNVSGYSISWTWDVLTPFSAVHLLVAGS